MAYISGRSCQLVWLLSGALPGCTRMMAGDYGMKVTRQEGPEYHERDATEDTALIEKRNHKLIGWNRREKITVSLPQ